jgi:hypoxanthine phosphoribosyltransferase
MESHKNLITWEHAREGIASLAKAIHASGFTPSLLVAIARGGWVPTRLLSDALGVKRIASIGIEYVNDSRDNASIYSLPEPIAPNEHILLIEDFLESGKSMNLARSVLMARQAIVRTAALYYSLQSELQPDYALAQRDSQPFFPWEVRPR